MTSMKAEFTEEDYISAIETMIARSEYTKNKQYIEISRISQDRERELGYDGVLTAIVPFYLQFKRSTFYTPLFTGKLAVDRNKSFSADKNIGFLAFGLHKDRHTKQYDQHNAIWNLSKATSAAYVAPLFYKTRDLTSLKSLASFLPWIYRHHKISDMISRSDYITHAIRTFRESIVIEPHREIIDKSPSHHYSYDRAMKNIAFHSNIEPVQTPPKHLHEYITLMIEKAIHLAEENKRDKPNDASTPIIEILPDLFNLTWDSRKFKTILQNHLIETDLISNELPVDIRNFLIKEISIFDRFNLIETLLKEELNIIQFAIRIYA